VQGVHGLFHEDVRDSPVYGGKVRHGRGPSLPHQISRPRKLLGSQEGEEGPEDRRPLAGDAFHGGTQTVHELLRPLGELRKDEPVSRRPDGDGPGRLVEEHVIEV
jgi:hypothetical protein